MQEYHGREIGMSKGPGKTESSAFAIILPRVP